MSSTPTPNSKQVHIAPVPRGVTLRPRMLTKRNSHFRHGFKINQPTKTKVKGFIGNPRRIARSQDDLTISEMLYRTGIKSPQALAEKCRSGQLPKWKREPLTDRVYWCRLEFEAFMFWQRCLKARRSHDRI